MKRRIIFGSLGLILSFFWIVGVWFFLGSDSTLRDIAFGYSPLSIQAITWVAFFLGLGELVARWIDALEENNQRYKRYLPEDESTILQSKDLGQYYKRVNTLMNNDRELFLPKLIRRIVLRFHSTKSVEQVATLLNTSMEYYANEIELRYSLLRYLVWFIPTLGFIGTVVGIMQSLNLVGEMGIEKIEFILTDVVKLLAVAFNTTLVALVLSAILMFLMNIIQNREESALNNNGQYCLDNLINRLYYNEN